MIGGGVMGSAAAYYLARAGARIVLLEQRQIGAAASGASAGGVRQQNRAAAELPLAMHAVRMWATLEHDLGRDLEYRRGGHLTLIDREEDLPALEVAVQRQREDGLDIRAVQGTELRSLVPHVGPGVLAGAYCPTDGFANPMLVTNAFAEAARREGARVYTGTRATGILRDGDRVEGVDSGRGRIACRWVVNAAGAWSAALSAGLGVSLPLRPRASQMMATAKAPALLTPVLTCIGRNLSLKQMPTGQFVIGGGWPGRPDLEVGRGFTRAGGPSGSARDVTAILPPTGKVAVVRVWNGLEAQCIDDLPILGAVDGLHGYVLATGFSGHGFALVPYVGLLVAELITNGATSHPLDDLSFRRFAASDPEQLRRYAADHSGRHQAMKVEG